MGEKETEKRRLRRIRKKNLDYSEILKPKENQKIFGRQQLINVFQSSLTWKKHTEQAHTHTAKMAKNKDELISTLNAVILYF